MINAISAGVMLAINKLSEYFSKKQTAESEQSANRQAVLVQHLAGWSDEYLLVIWSYPFWSSFVPVLAPHTQRGFENIGLLPEWYINGFMLLTGAVFGVNKFMKWKK